MADYYDRNFAFFPDHLNSAHRKYLYFYLLERTEAKVRAHGEIVGNPDTVPIGLYRRSGPHDGPMTVRRTDSPGIIVEGTVCQLFRRTQAES